MSSGSDAELLLRPAQEDDAPLIFDFIRGLAEYEQLIAEVRATEQDIRESLFGSDPSAECLLAYWGGEPAGFAVYFRHFSTFEGKPGLYLEDLFVKPEFRGKGIGGALLRRLASVAKERRCARFEWAVLDWNEPAILFYAGLGARPLNDWTLFRLEGAALDALAGG
jgi:GNAT superfamily N-acetyltransferase